MRGRWILISGRRTPRPPARPLLLAFLLFACAASDPRRHARHGSAAPPHAVAVDGPRAARPAGRVNEVVPDKYLKKYERWKAEYLSTSAGSRQWERYAADAGFTLTILVSEELEKGGVVGDYRWDDSGKLVAATITLGHRLDDGLPAPLLYPVTGALASQGEGVTVSGDVLAAAKFAHEFGHVNRAADDPLSFRRQSGLVAQYMKLFEESGYDAADAGVLEIKRMLGGTPFDVKKERELSAEANALTFLQERLSNEGRGARELFSRIRKSVRDYGRGHLNLPD